MQEDSLNVPTPGYSKQNQVFTQESPKKSFHCSRCILLFKSKAFLFEHLNKVHGCDVDAALREAGLKYPENNKANTDSNSNAAEDDFECRLCDFKAYSPNILNEHERQCHKTSEDVKENEIIPENPETGMIVTSTNPHSEAAGAKEISSVLSVTSTSKSLCTLNSSKDLKTYKRPLKTIDQYFAASSGSNGKPPGNSAESPNFLDGTKGTIILKKSPSSSSPNSSGVFKVTAKSMIDIIGSGGVSHRFLQNDQLTDPTAPKPTEPSREMVPDKVGKRINRETLKGPPAKKAKSCKDETKLPQEEHATEEHATEQHETEQQAPSNTEFPFDISEDEGEKELCLVNGDSESSTVYYCKHCVYSDASLACTVAHYQNNHPYVRYTAAYIQDPSDRSATFRCLQCPVEFVGVSALKRHYHESHPEAPNIFTRHSRDLSLVFKCFLCMFTTNELKALKTHYKESHPTHGMDNSLLYCRYLATECQEGLTQSNICEKPQSPQRPAGVSPESACTPDKEVKNAPTAQHPTAKATDVVLYHCNTCKFSHKSVVVLHVHYQKCHPGQEITIDKIKRSTRVTSHTTPPKTPDKSPNSATTTEASTPQTNVSDSSRNTQSKADRLQPKSTSEASKTPTDSSKTKKAESTEDEGKCKELPEKRARGMSKKKISLSGLPPSESFFCQFCSYSSNNIKSVLGHHNAKHSVYALTCMDEILCYSAQVQNKKLQSEARAAAKTSSSNSNTSKQVEVPREEVPREEDEAADAFATEENAYACAENMFYCQKCNYGNPSLKGIANHQNRIHRSLVYRRDRILEHTAGMRNQIKKSKFEAKAFSFSTRLPLPFINEGDEDAFFCHFCNYRQSTVDYVVRHYIKKHHGYAVTAEQIRLHTSMVREKTDTANQDVTHASLGGKGNKKRKIKMPDKLPTTASAPPSITASQPQRILRCYRCPYGTQYLHALRRHIWKIHRANRSIADVLRVCYKQGNLQTGYHCDMCVFSHEKAAAVHEHYLEQHPGRSPSLEYVSSRLYVGPDSQPPTRKKPKVKYTGDCDGSDGSSPSGQSEPKTYSCRACSFKCGSVSGVTSHYRAVHPWSVKEDGSVLGVVNSKRPSANRQVEESDVVPESFESYQMPLEFEAGESSTHLACPYCPAKFNTQHGLNTHCGMKHHEAEYDNSDQYQQKIQSLMSVFKCPHCAYVNTSHQGVLSHCHMKHHTLESSVESLPMDDAQLSHWGDFLKRKGPGYLKLSGYSCETCPQICATQEKLNKHLEKDHARPVAIPVPSALEPAPEPPPMGKRKQLKILSNRGPFSQAALLSKKSYPSIKCQYCIYGCSTKLGLDRHVRIHHKTASASKALDCVYRCVLCSCSYYTKVQLGSHYIRKHGRDSFLKHYAPVYNQVQEKQPSTSHDLPLTEKPEDAGEACETSTTMLLVYRCPSCPYLNTSYHGTLTHCQMKHPDIVARADELQTEEILKTNLVACTVGKGANERGYICKLCPLIYASLKKLKIHCGKDHPQALPAAPEHSADIEADKPPELCSQVLASEPALQSQTLAVSATGNDLGDQSPAETAQPNTLSLHNKITLYKCHMCSYKGFYRRYLLSHYKKTHKLDPHTTRKLLQKYNKRKKTIEPPGTDSEEVAPITCKKCPELIFDSSQLLVDHYSTFHSSDSILDFTVLSQGKKKGSTGLYRCVHCSKQMNGIRKLCYHLDCHRMEAIKRAEAAEMAASPEDQPVEVIVKEELVPLDIADELAQWNETSVQPSSSPPSPLSPLSKPADEEQPREDKHACRRCRRTFMSLKGLRSHERSHAAMAAIKKLNNAPTSVLKHNINKFVLYKPGTIKPFLCSFCSYRTTVMGLWRCHFRKEHQDVMADAAVSDDLDEESDQKADCEPFNSSEDVDSWPEPDEEPEIAEKSLYLEPPDVQRQLNHYSSRVKSEANLQDTKSHDNRLLHCEFCSFNTEHLSSQRRHYLNRHGKKILRCKDCEFFTAFRKTLEMHMKAGHATRQSEPNREKDLRCPFCLYQTRNRNSMIDHIVLHREERVVPIEVRRPALSRYLKGVVFRCHKCTFSSGSADNLRSHMTKHDDVKPYKCRLCYFDCTWLSDLEAHLSDKHQVVRNHELVGQVSLDQLQARVGGMPEEEPSSNLERRRPGGENVGTLEKKEEIPSRISELDAKPNAAIRPKLGGSEDSGVAVTRQKEEAEGSSLTYGEEISICRTNQKADQGRAVKTEDIETEVVDHVRSELVSLDERGGGPLSHNPQNQVNTKAISISARKNLMQDNDNRPQGCFAIARHLLTLSSNCAQLKTSREESSAVSFPNCKKERVHSQETSAKVREPYGEMPVLENEYLKEEMQPPGCCKKENESDRLGPKKDEEDEAATKDDESRRRKWKREEGEGMKHAGTPQGAFAAAGGAEVSLPAAAEEKPFTCEFCGRNLMNSSDLERHITRHGL